MDTAALTAAVATAAAEATLELAKRSRREGEEGGEGSEEACTFFELPYPLSSSSSSVGRRGLGGDSREDVERWVVEARDLLKPKGGVKAAVSYRCAAARMTARIWIFMVSESLPYPRLCIRHAAQGSSTHLSHVGEIRWKKVCLLTGDSPVSEMSSS
jgi:hypothetical protein